MGGNGSRRRWERALVTGASSGIGVEFARQLAADGTHLVLVARSTDKLEELAGELRDTHKVVVDVLSADLADGAQLATVEARVATVDQPVDLLVNNAGYGYNNPFGETPVDDEEAEIRVNVIALMRLSHAAARRMPATGGGGILNVSSIAAFQPAPESANYSATKAYVTSFSQSLHAELKDQGVHVTVLHPGLTRTEFQQRGGYNIGLPDAFWQSPGEVARAGLDAVAANDAVEVAGWQNKVLVSSVRVLPMAVQRFAAGQVTRRFR
jgi:short-subunit dehydrogenase